MSLLSRIQEDVKTAMRARDTERTTSLRMLVAALQGESKSKQRDLEQDEEIAVLTRERKKRAEAAEAFAAAGAAERADAERTQIAEIEQYLPEQLSEDEVRQLVEEAVEATGATSPRDMGQVMKALMPKVHGRADGKLVSQTVSRVIAERAAEAP